MLHRREGSFFLDTGDRACFTWTRNEYTWLENVEGPYFNPLSVSSQKDLIIRSFKKQLKHSRQLATDYRKLIVQSKSSKNWVKDVTVLCLVVSMERVGGKWHQVHVYKEEMMSALTLMLLQVKRSWVTNKLSQSWACKTFCGV